MKGIEDYWTWEDALEFADKVVRHNGKPRIYYLGPEHGWTADTVAYSLKR